MRIEYQSQTRIYPEGYKVIRIYKGKDGWKVIQHQPEDETTLLETFDNYLDALDVAIDLAREQENEQS